MSKKYLLDTNICVHLLRDKFGVAKKIDDVGLDNCYISEITVAELKVGFILGNKLGIRHKRDINEFFSKINVLAISGILDLFAEEKVRLRLAGTPLDDDFDLLIGCTAVNNRMIMVTENIKDFKNIKGIKIENWVNRNE